MAEEDEAIVDIVVECFHSLSARVQWPDEALKRRFEERLSHLHELVQAITTRDADRADTEPEQDESVPVAGEGA